jgi:hypothetical protein
MTPAEVGAAGSLSYPARYPLFQVKVAGYCRDLFHKNRPYQEEDKDRKEPYQDK